MLTAFLRDQKEHTVNCTIPKFVDRIFVPSDIFLSPNSQKITIVRLICFGVSDRSTSPAHHVIMVMPRREMVVTDISNLMLDQNYTWMKAASEYDVLDQGRRHIRWDGLPGVVRIARRLSFTRTNTDRFTFTKISFGESVNPGEFFGFGLQIKLCGILERLSLLERQIDLPYFYGRPLEELAGKSEISCLAWHSGSPQEMTVNGGFDVILAHSPKHGFSPFLPEPTIPGVVIKNDIGGTEKDSPVFVAHGWKPRKLFTSLSLNPQMESSSLELNVRGVLKITPPIWLIPLLIIVINFALAIFLAPNVRRLFGLP